MQRRIPSGEMSRTFFASERETIEGKPIIRGILVIGGSVVARWPKARPVFVMGPIRQTWWDERWEEVFFWLNSPVWIERMTCRVGGTTGRLRWRVSCTCYYCLHDRLIERPSESDSDFSTLILERVMVKQEEAVRLQVKAVCRNLRHSEGWAEATKR